MYEAITKTLVSTSIVGPMIKIIAVFKGKLFVKLNQTFSCSITPLMVFNNERRCQYDNNK